MKLQEWCILVFLCLSLPPLTCADYWTHCGFVEGQLYGITLTTTAPWLRLQQTKDRISLLCKCSSQQQDWTATVQVKSPSHGYTISYTLLPPCYKTGCYWNPSTYFTVPKGGSLKKDKGTFELDKGGLVQWRTDKSRDVVKWINITLPIELRDNNIKSYSIQIIQSLPFDVQSCLSTANTQPSNTLTLSISPLSQLAWSDNDIHHSSISTAVSSPSPGVMRRATIRMVRQTVNTPPRFDTLFYTERLDENNDSGVTVGTVHANDPDSGVGGQITYSLLPGSDSTTLMYFDIDPESGEITVNVMLDHELTPELTFRVLATDGLGDTGMSQYRLEVGDLNDNHPTFQQGSYHNISISEDSQVGTELLQLIVVDEDSGSNGQVVYSLLNNPDYTFNILQSGNQATLTLREGLDYETRTAYQLTVLAHDGGTPVLSSSATVDIHVTDVADTLPVFNATSYSVSLAEDTVPIAYLLTVHAVSSDSPGLAGLEYFIVQGDLDGRFTLGQATGVLSLLQRLDYERTQAYVLTVQAQSVINPTLRSSVNVHVGVVNINDHLPSFTRSQYSISVLESVSPPAAVVTVTAEDLDLGDYGEISYGFHPDTEADILSTFEINFKTGAVSTVTALDREQREMYSFVVQANDGGSPSLVAEVTVVIRVTDVNDERPVFTRSEYIGTIRENMATGSEVTRVQAMDSDSELSSIEYYIQGGNYGNAFTIGTSDGTITNRIHLDREERSEYMLVVIATDHQFESLPVIVYINVTDENDQLPIFQTSLYTLPPVPETTPTGTELIRVVAMDRDVGSNSEVTYSSPEVSPTFALDPSSGAITIAQPLDYESSVTSYTLTVTARDNGVPQLSSSTRVEIYVSDENDNAPVFEGVPYQVSVTENQPSHTSVTQLSASDADSGLNSDLVYSVVGDSEAVSVFNVYQTGLVYTLEPLDRERQSHYQVVVQVSDRGAEPLTDDVTITVTVDDVIDYPPLFSQLVYTVLVTMTTPMNSELVTVSASTKDLQSDIFYEITSGDRTLFNIDQTSGVITTATNLDPVSNAGEYILHVTAQHFELSGLAPVIITVIKEDGVPRLEPLTVYFSIYEGQLSELNYIGRVAVARPIEGEQYSFSLVNSDPCVRRYFNVSQGTGELLISRGVSSGIYSLNVTVSASTGLSGHALVTVYVRIVTNSTLDNTVVASFAGLREANFVTLQMEQFVSHVMESVPCTREQVEVIGIVSSGAEMVQLAFAIRDITNLAYVDQFTVVDRLQANRHNVRPPSLVGYDVDVCVSEPCPNLQSCSQVVRVAPLRPSLPYRTLQLSNLIFISQPFTLEHTCHCPYGYNRFDLCTSSIDLCDPSPCHFGGSCHDNVLDYQCDCPRDTFGKNCSVVCPSTSCDPCRPTPCLNGGVCSTTEQNPAHYTCDECPWDPEISGPNCELSSLSFKQGSFVAFSRILFTANLKISLDFVTVSPNGLLLYSGRGSGRHDYVSIELVIGQIRVSVSFGGDVTTIHTESSWQLNNAEWHTVDVELRDRVLSVSVSGCGQGALVGVNYQCEETTTLIGQSRTLDVTTPLYIGGLEPHIQRSEFISSTSYTGCIANVVMGGTLLDFNAPLRSAGVEIGCPPLSDRCITSGQCSSRNQCVDVWNGTVCSCEGESPLCGPGTSVQLLPGYLQLSLSSPTSLDHFSVAFRTRSTNAVLAQLGSVGTVELAHGSVVFRRAHSSEHMLTALTLTAEAYVNDGLWHQITLSHSNTHTKLTVDVDRVTALSTERGSLPLQTITLGADQPLTSSSRYIGCLGILVINNQVVDLGPALSTSPTGYIVTHGGAASGCGSGGPCDGIQCPVNSICQEGWRNYSCLCDTSGGYRVSDEACLDPCDPSPCLNGGTCFVPPITSSTLFQCECGSYSGVRCEGVSSDSCEAGYHGQRCELCRCDPRGAVEGVCDAVSGSCKCKVGDYYSRSGDLGCTPCDCHVTGAASSRCDAMTGQCVCRPNVSGRRCDRCASGYAGMDDTGCKEAVSLFGRFSLAQDYHGNLASSVYFDLSKSLSGALESELLTFGLSGQYEVTIRDINNSSGLVGVAYQVARYNGHAPLHTIGSALQVIVQSGWAGPHRLVRDSHHVAVTCDQFPALCGDCPVGTSRDDIICRATPTCSGQDSDRDGIPDTCDNCTLTFNPDQDPSACAIIQGACPGGVASGVLWTTTPEGSIDVKLCAPPLAGYAHRSCKVGGVWDEVSTIGCLSLQGQQLLQQASSLASGQLLNVGELMSLLSHLTAITAHPPSGSDVRAAASVLTQLLPLLPGYSTGHVQTLLQNCSAIASNLLQPELSSHWSTTIPDVTYTAEDLLSSLEELFTLSRQLQVYVSEEFLGTSSGESPTANVVVGNQKVRVYLPEELATPTLGVVLNLGLWLPSKYSFSTESVNLTVATPLLSIQGSKVTSLTTPLNMTFPYRSTVVRPAEFDHAHCVYWDYGRGWSTSGCGLVTRNHTHITCSCSHLTVFAALTPASVFEPHPPVPTLGHPPEVFTYIVLSLVAMVMVVCFVVFACLPSVRTLQTFCHMNLLVVLSLAAVTFLVGVNRVEVQGLCACLGALLMFLLLSCLSWLVADSLIIARFLLTPPPKRNFVVYLIIIGWLLPVFMCGIPLGAVGILRDTFVQDLGYPNYCWLSPDVIYAFIAPVIILLLLYVVGVVFSFVMLAKMTKNDETTGVDVVMSKNKVRMALLVSMVTMFLVIATWLFGVLALYLEKYLEYPFAILHAVLAVYLFLVYCCNSQVREAVKGRLSRKRTDHLSTQATVNSSTRAPSSLQEQESERRLTGTYAEVELVYQPEYTRPRSLSRHHTSYVTQAFHNPLSEQSSLTVTPSTPHTSTPHEEAPKKEKEWFTIPEPVPLSPLTFSGESHDPPEPVYSQIVKSHDRRSRSPDSTDIDHAPSISIESKDGGNSPASYLEVEPMTTPPLHGANEDLLWYRHRDSMSVEVDPRPYETAVVSPYETVVQSAVRTSLGAEPSDTPTLQTVTKQQSLSDDWTTHRRVSSKSSNSSPVSSRAPQHTPPSSRAPQHTPPSSRAPQHTPPSSQAPQHTPPSSRAPQHTPPSSRAPQHTPPSSRAPNGSQYLTDETKPSSVPLKRREVNFEPLFRKKRTASRTTSLPHPHTSHTHIHNRLSDVFSPQSSQVTSRLPSSLQVQVGCEGYHRDGPSSARDREGSSHVIRHADGSETVQSLV